MASADLSVINRLHNSILLTQRKMRAIRLLLPSELSVLESIILSHLAYDPERNARDLVALLGISKSKISRLLGELEKLGCLSTEVDPSDKRVRHLNFTERGRQMLAEADQLNSRISQIGCALLSPRELVQMVELFHRLNNGLKAPPERLREGESMFAPEQRRAVIAMGMLGDNYMQTGFNLAQYQVLMELARQRSEIRFADLCANLPISSAKVSRILSAFEAEGIVNKKTPKDDKRARVYFLTTKGLRVHAAAEYSAAQVFVAGTEDLLESELEELASLLELIDRATVPTPDQAGFRISPCEEEGLRRKARAFLVEQLVRTGRHKNLDQYLLPDDSFCCAATWHVEILALAEIRTSGAKRGKKGGEAELRNFAVAAKITGTEQEREALAEALRLAASQLGVKKINLPEKLILSKLAAEVAESLPEISLALVPDK